jgi:hypothetical protein
MTAPDNPIKARTVWCVKLLSGLHTVNAGTARAQYERVAWIIRRLRFHSPGLAISLLMSKKLLHTDKFISAFGSNRV